MESFNKSNVLGQIKQIKNKIKNLKIEEKNIQDICKHQDTYVNFNEKGRVKLYCELCNKDMGYPSAADLKSFLNKN
jgi:hypothetical protein